MPERNRRAALRAVQAATQDAEGKLGVAEGKLGVAEATLGAADIAPPPLTEPIPLAEPLEPAPRPSAREPEPTLERLLPDEWRAKVTAATAADAIEVGGERVRRRVDEEMVYLAVRVPRSLRDAVRRRADRLEVSMQEFVIRAAGLLLEATARAADGDA